jgi:hypothetical protein
VIASAGVVALVSVAGSVPLVVLALVSVMFTGSSGWVKAQSIKSEPMRKTETSAD